MEYAPGRGANHVDVLGLLESDDGPERLDAARHLSSNIDPVVTILLPLMV